MTGVGVSWSAPAWVGFGDEDYRKMLRRKAMAVTRRDKRRDVPPVALGRMVRANAVSFHMSKETSPLRRV